MEYFVAIDDTDNNQSRGTGFRARELAALISASGMGMVTGVTRHQLYVHKDIPFTSHNSSACIGLDSSFSDIPEGVEQLASSYLRQNSAEGSDAGLCICRRDFVNEDILAFGLRAKNEVLTMPEAYGLAAERKIFLMGYTGTHQGIIGALAAIGLRASGNDGRFLMLAGMRTTAGIFSVAELMNSTGIQQIVTRDNQKITNFERIFLPEWWKAVLRNHKAVLIVEPSETPEYEYRVIPKDDIKGFSA